MKTWHVLVPLLVLSSGAFYARQQRQQRAEIEQLRQQTAELASSVNDNQEQMARRLAAQSLLQGLAQAAPVQEANAPPVAAAATVKQAMPVQQSTAPRREVKPTEVAAYMDAAFSRETVDGNWSAKTQQTTQEKLSALLPKDSAVLSMDCRTSLCRVEMSHQSMDDYKKFMRSAYMNPAAHVWDGPTFTTLLEDSGGGGVVAVSFLGREGQNLPQMPE